MSEGTVFDTLRGRLSEVAFALSVAFACSATIGDSAAPTILAVALMVLAVVVRAGDSARVERAQELAAEQDEAERLDATARGDIAVAVSRLEALRDDVTKLTDRVQDLDNRTRNRTR